MPVYVLTETIHLRADETVEEAIKRLGLKPLSSAQSS